LEGVALSRVGEGLLGRFFYKLWFQGGVVADYLLVFDPVEVKVMYVKTVGLWLEEGEPATLGRIVFTDFDFPSGARRVRELSRKWYRLDVKFLASVAPRYAAERYAPVFEFRLPPYCSATVDMLWGSLNVVWGAPVEERQGLIRIVPLFRNVEDIKNYLEGQAVFAQMVEALTAVKVLRAGEIAAAVASAFERAADLAAAFVSKVPGAQEIVEKVLSKYNVTYKDLVDFAVSEEVARRLVARLVEISGEQQAAGGGGAK
jgi:hypothetical protein